MNGKQVLVLIKLSNNKEYDLINYKVHGCILHASHGHDREALTVAQRLLEQGLSPKATTVSSLLKSVAIIGVLVDLTMDLLRLHAAPGRP
jgi:hypothetical protein